MLPVEMPDTRRSVGGAELTVLATTQETNGDLFAVELRMPPGGGPPVMHRHAPSEVYRILSGEFTFYLTGPTGHHPPRGRAGGGGDDRRKRPAHCPQRVGRGCGRRAGSRARRAHGGVPAARPRLAADHEPTIDEVLAIAERNGIELLGPVPDGV